MNKDNNKFLQKHRLHETESKVSLRKYFSCKSQQSKNIANKKLKTSILNGFSQSDVGQVRWTECGLVGVTLTARELISNLGSVSPVTGPTGMVGGLPLHYAWDPTTI